MAQRGVVKSGEAFCLECKSSVDRDAVSCSSCGSTFEDETRAFSCPRCSTVLPLGTSECAQCGMRFRIKALRQRIAPWTQAEVQIDEENAGTYQASEESAKAAQDESAAEGAVEMVSLSVEQSGMLQALVDSISELGKRRAEFLSKMKRRNEEEPRLAEMRSADDASTRLELVESEVAALADEIADISKLRSDMLSIVDEVSAMAESLDMNDEGRVRSFSARAKKIVTQSGDHDGNTMNAREDQLARREEMVDRKIRGYASKRKELEDREAEIVAKTVELEREKAALEQSREVTPAVSVDTSGQSDQVKTAEAEITARVLRLCKALSDGLDGSASNADMTAESGLVLIEETTKRLLSDKRASQARLKEIEEQESETRRLLEVLDQLLGRLPEDVIEEFTQSEDYKLYGRMLDRYKI